MSSKVDGNQVRPRLADHVAFIATVYEAAFGQGLRYVISSERKEYL